MKKFKKLLTLLVLTMSFSAVALFGFGEEDSADVKKKTAADCEIPTYAKMIGHEDKWLLHNGCPPRKDTKDTDKDAESKDAK